jgi:hypothetical protein
MGKYENINENGNPQANELPNSWGNGFYESKALL